MIVQLQVSSQSVFFSKKYRKKRKSFIADRNLSDLRLTNWIIYIFSIGTGLVALMFDFYNQTYRSGVLSLGHSR